MKPSIKYRSLWLVAIAITITIYIILFAMRSETSFGFSTGQEKEERQSGAEKQLASWLWSRGYPDPSNINQKYNDAWMYMNGLRDPERRSGAYGDNGTSGTTIFSGNWASIGPDINIGGRVLSIAIDPSNGNNLFAGTASGGIWRSANGGTSWTSVRTGYPVAGVSSIVYDPSNSNILYAGTGEVYRVDTSNIGFNVWKARGTYGVGILKSTDRGITWSQVFNRSVSSLFGIQMIKFDPVNSSIVYVCATDGLYRSANAGSTWTKILTKTYVADLVISSTNSNLLVASVGNLQNSDKGIYKSTNGGTTWTKMTAGLPASFQGFIRLDNVRTNGNLIIASVGRDAGSQNELFRSNDFGNTWTALSSSNHCQYQFWFAHDVAINPSNTNVMIMGGVNLYRYTASPLSVAVVRGVHADIHDIKYDPSNSNIVYVASDGGVYKSTNGGTNFTAINNGLKAVQFYASFAVSPTNPNIMVGGLQDNGVVRYNGTSWMSVSGGDGGPCVFHPTNSNIVFASNDARRLLRSTNGGSSFSEVLSSWAFTADSRTGFMAPVAISKSDPTILYSGSDNIHKSTNTGISGSWNGNSYSTATSYIEARHKTAIALAVSPLNANKLYVSTSPFAQYDNDANNLHVNNPPNIMKSINGGASFVSIKGSLPDRFIMDFAISPTNDDSVWIALGGFGSPHIYVTGNGGSTWTSKSNGLPDVPTNAIAIDPYNPKIIYAANDLGVFVSPDMGTTWHDYNNGLWDATMIVDLVITSNRKIVAATHGKGVFISDLLLETLPVELGNLTVISNGNNAQLKWNTLQETNVAIFEIERSIDGISFAKAGAVNASNSPGGSSYQYNDPITPNASVIFYRLKIVDKDGAFEYTKIVSLRIKNLSDLILKNPFDDNLKFEFNSEVVQVIVLSLFDESGGLVLQKNIHAIHGVNSIHTNVSAIPNGLYLFQLKTRDQLYAMKVLKGR